MSPRTILGALALAVIAGCSRSSAPPAIATGTPCASCGMEVQDLGFACERVRAGSARVYDSIECLLRDPDVAGERVYLTDYDSKGLHAADSLWIVKGRFPTPMDGGLAAFSLRRAADEVASRTQGRVGRWSEALDLLRSVP